MFSYFAKAPAPFKPILAPLPQRRPCSGGCNEQNQSPLFGKFPAEIRNHIYRHLFTGEAREPLSIEAHPLSLLLTCHRASHEATALAFSSHAFQVARHLNLTTFVTMGNALAHLFPYQKDGITALSYDLGSSYFRSEYSAAAGNVLTNAIILLPNLSRFEIRVVRGSKGTDGIHRPYPQPWCYTPEDARKQAAQPYAPCWFTSSILWYIRFHSWQAGEHWEVAWPQFADDEFLDIVAGCHWSGKQSFKVSMSPDAVGRVRGVHMCPCQCGEVSWTSADLIQETGRRVAIDTIFYGLEERPLPPITAEDTLRARLGHKAVILKEGSTPLQVAQGEADFFGTGTRVTSVAYECEDRYWKSLSHNWEFSKLKKGEWGAVARGLWKEALWGMPKDDHPGSWSLGEGDWARMKELAEGDKSVETMASEDANTRPESSNSNSVTRHITRKVC
ncbi:hypothetical protein BKA63DRAFT_157069 [Paraphoma chrysanthemicola]|nr:hypothetical protein BKA63DRAFT_157069 [Paraphoma chrysanthemicola]